MFNLTPSEIALAISTGITIYQIYGWLGYGATEFSFQISLLIIGFTLIICSLRRDLDDSQLRKP
jgi:hypothetical protein